MIMSYSECCEKFGGRYRTDQLIREGKLFKVATGLYSDTPDWSDIEVVLAKYPNAVVTLQSAYYYYELSDSIPEVFHLATDRDASKIYDERIVQPSIRSVQGSNRIIPKDKGNAISFQTDRLS